MVAGRVLLISEYLVVDNENAVLIAGQLPLGCRGQIEDEDPIITFGAGRHAVGIEAVAARGMRALIAAAALLHLPGTEPQMNSFHFSQVFHFDLRFEIVGDDSTTSTTK